MNDLIPLNDIEKAGRYIAQSKLFGVKTPDEAIALMLIAQGEGRNPFEAARDYHIIQGRPALKADAIMSRFQQAGGSVKWLQYDDKKVSGEFTHPQGGTVTITWTFEQAQKIGLTAKDNWKNYPRAMLRARCISEGVRTVYPGACSGIYTKEEVEDMTPERMVSDPEIIIQEHPAPDQETVIQPSEDELKAEGKKLVTERLISKERQAELWAQAKKNMPDYIALLRAEPEVSF